MKVKAVTKTTRELDTNHVVELFKERVRNTQEQGNLWASVPLFSLVDAADIIETLVADNQKKDARIKDVISQCDKLFEEKKTVEKQRDELADKLAKLAAEKVENNRPTVESRVELDITRKAMEKADEINRTGQLCAEFNDWAFRTFGGFGDVL